MRAILLAIALALAVPAQAQAQVSITRAGSTSAFAPSTYGTSGQVWTSGGSGVAPNWATPAAAPAWLVKTTTYTAATGERIVANSTGGAFTITLPITPTTGHNVQVKSGPSAAASNVTIARNGSTIMGAASNLLLDVDNIDVSLVYDGSTWRF